MSCVWLFLLLAMGCGRAPGPAKAITDVDPARATITAQQAQSLKIRSEPVVKDPKPGQQALVSIKQIQEQRWLSGWIMAPPGKEVTLTAPVAGIVRAVGGAALAPGKLVTGGKETLLLEPVLGPVEQIQLAALKRGIDSELVKARESATVSASEFKRMEELHEQKLRGLQDVEQARARLKHAEEDLNAARDKQKLFAGFAKDNRLAPVPLLAPTDGTILAVHANPGQVVSAAAPLATVADLSRPWVRVAIAEHDLPRLDRKQEVKVVSKWTGKDAVAMQARPLELVPQVDPIRHTADMLYELKGAMTGSLAKEQMVSVRVPFGEARAETVVPDGAAVVDVVGGGWIIYLDRTKPGAAVHVYERRRVTMGPPLDDGIVIRPLLEPGDKVVIAGAAELYGLHREGQAASVIEDDD